MNADRTVRPAEDEFASFYAGYVAAVPDGDIAETLRRQLDEVNSLLARIPEEKERFRYAEGKWSVRQLVGHVVDAERIFAYRLLCIARGEQNELPGFDEESYSRIAGHDGRALSSIAAEFDGARRSNIHLIESLDEEALRRRGVANRYPISVRGIAWILAGHAAHHLRILRERYEIG